MDNKNHTGAGSNLTFFSDSTFTCEPMVTVVNKKSAKRKINLEANKLMYIRLANDIHPELSIEKIEDIPTRTLTLLQDLTIQQIVHFIKRIYERISPSTIAYLYGINTKTLNIYVYDKNRGFKNE